VAILEAPCTRCLEHLEALERAPMPGPLGARIKRQVCARCWQEWTEMEVRVINELRLNFMDPQAQEVLERHLRDFLALPASSGE
jgi:Fe-S cluster biosynthesis and repair protein YggX